MTIPYTYLIGWSQLDTWYYGVRWAKGCDPVDLFNPYKTSSKHVKRFVETHGLPDVKEIRHTFNESLKARQWESRVLRKMKVLKSDRWLNKTDNRAISYDVHPMKGKHLSDETKLKLSFAGSGKVMPQSVKAKIAAGRIGKRHSENALAKMRAAKLGRKLSEETKYRMSISHMGNINSLGFIHSNETRAKLSKARLGNQNARNTE